LNKIPSLNRAEAEFFRQIDEIATAVMTSLDEFADEAAGGVGPEVEPWLRRGAARPRAGGGRYEHRARARRSHAGVGRGPDAPGRAHCGTAEVGVAMSAPLAAFYRTV